MTNNLISNNEIQIIIFQLEKKEYAMPISCVQVILPKQPLSKIPKTSSFIEGLINLKGQNVSIIDGRKKFQLETIIYNDSESQIMILEIGKETIGLIVDTVSEIACIKKEAIKSSPTAILNGPDFLWGIGTHKDRQLTLIDPEKLLTDKEFDHIKELLNNEKGTTSNNDLLISV